MKAIIHIGMPKTGTTSIKTWMRVNQTVLEKRGVRMITIMPANLLLASIHVALHEFGVDEKSAWQGVEGKLIARVFGLEVDENASRKEVAEQKRARAEIVKNAYEFMTNEFRKLSGRSGTLIWSDERFFNKNKLILPLDEFLGRFFEDRTYVAYIRNTVDHLVSNYSKMIQLCDEEFGTMHFSEYLNSAQAKTSEAARIQAS